MQIISQRSCLHATCALLLKCTAQIEVDNIDGQIEENSELYPTRPVQFCFYGFHLPRKGGGGLDAWRWMGGGGSSFLSQTTLQDRSEHPESNQAFDTCCVYNRTLHQLSYVRTQSWLMFCKHKATIYIHELMRGEGGNIWMVRGGHPNQSESCWAVYIHTLPRVVRLKMQAM